MNGRRFLFVLIAIFCLLFFQSTLSIGEEKEVWIGLDDYYHEIIEASPGDTVKYEVNVTHGDEIDVYILAESEYERYQNNEDFNTAKSYEKVMSVIGKYEIEYSRDHYLIIDNKDNAHEHDAQPESDVDVTINLTIEQATSSDKDSIFGGGGLVTYSIMGALEPVRENHTFTITPDAQKVYLSAHAP